MKSIPSYLDRYPAKMVTTLADKIIEKYVDQESVVLDPFCGSSAILKAALKKNSKIYGLDINPYAILLSNVKLNGFDQKKAIRLLNNLVSNSIANKNKLVTNFKNIDYWFTSSILDQMLSLRFYFKQANLKESQEGQAILLAYALSIRIVSNADQRSPKPFISKLAKKRDLTQINPYVVIKDILEKLCEMYGVSGANKVTLKCANSVNLKEGLILKNSISHIITSPPYINAQDYFRNFKLELYLLEGLLDFDIIDIKESFIGTEKGNLLIQRPFKLESIDKVSMLVAESNKRLSRVIIKYFFEMQCVLDSTYDFLKTNGKLILVCGDNVVSGQKVPTWQILNEIAEIKGYHVVDRFEDRISKRTLAPKRMGHKSFIKEEIVTVFQKN